MPKATKNSAQAEATVSTQDELIESGQDELSSSDQGQDPEGLHLTHIDCHKYCWIHSCYI